MANTIILKKSSTASAIPSAGSLQPGELAVNLADAKLYTKTTGGTVILVGSAAGGGGSGTVTSVAASGGTTGLTFSGSPITTSGTFTLGGTLAIANGGTGATTAPTARSNLSAAVLGANGDITSLTGITNGISSPDFVQFDTTATVTPAAGRLYFNDGEGGLSYTLKGGNVVQEVGQSQQVLVYNGTGATLNKGQVVYSNGAQGQRPTVALALATSDATSARTLGVVAESIANGAEGFVSTLGVVENINTSTFTAGAQLYLSGSTAGSLTETKPVAPIHMVYVARCIKSHAVSGRLFVTVQNGYELDELHDVSAVSPSNGQTIVYNSTNSLWEKNTVSLTAGVNGTLPIANGGTGATTAGAALTALGAYPSANPSGYTSNVGTVTGVTGTAPIVSSGGAAPAISISAATTSAAGSMSSTDKTKLDGIAANANNYVLPKATATALGGVEVFDATVQTVAANAVSATASRTYGVQLNAADQMVVNVPWTDANSGGTVTSVAGTGTVSGLTLSGTVTTSGSLTLGGTLAVTASNFSSQTAKTFLAAPNGAAGVPTFRAIVAADIPTLNQNTTGTALNVTGTVAVGNGGTGVTTSTGTGSVVLSNSPTFVTPTLGAASATSIANALGAVGTPSYTFTGDTNTGMWSPAADTIAFSEGGTEAMRISSAGDVGIGTSSPSTRLDAALNSGGYWTGSSWTATPTAITVTNTNPGGYDPVFIGRMTDTGGTSKNAFVIGAVGTSSWTAGNNASQTADLYVAVRDNAGGITERMRITTLGNVGIGTTGPTYRLDVASADTTAGLGYAMRIRANATAAGGAFQFTDSGATTQWGYLAATATSVTLDASGASILAFRTNSNERMRVTSAGDVGIGTTAPTEKLYVNGNIGVASNILMGSGLNNANNIEIGVGRTGSNFAYIDLIGDTTYTDYGLRIIRGNTGANTSSEINHRGTGDFVLSAVDAAPLRFNTSSTERMRIDGSGNVGIGTSTPAYKFEVKGSPSWFRNFNGTPASPTEAQDWPVAALNIASFGDYTDQTMLAFTLPNDGNYFLGYDAWNFKLNQTASSTTSAGVNGMRFGGPGYLAFMPGGTEKVRILSTGGITSSALADAVGYKGLPQNSQTASYTLALDDMGKMVNTTTGGVVIPANASVAFPIGSTVVVYNNSASSQTISITTDTIYLAGTATTGSRTLAQRGLATCVKVGSTTWVVSGNVT